MIYLDNNATTPLLPAVKEAVIAALEHYGNPSSVHQAGQVARHDLDEARRKVAALVGVRPEQVVFTASGTEANNMALKGYLDPVIRGEKGGLITQMTEHKCVFDTADYLQRRGHNVRMLPVDQNGVIQLEALEEALKEGGFHLVSVMHANNETGVLQPLADIAALCQQHGVALHTDAVQTVGKQPFHFPSMGIHMATLSFHKMGGLKGVGALIVGAGIQLEPLLHGGGQERKRRSGTENTVGITSAGVACDAAEGLIQQHDTLKALRDRFEEGVKAALSEVRIAGEGAARLHTVSHIVVPGITSEMLVMGMDMAGVCVSQGSACSSGRTEPSRVLEAMGYGADAGCGIRLAVGWQTTAQEIDEALSAFIRVVKQLRH